MERKAHDIRHNITEPNPTPKNEDGPRGSYKQRNLCYDECLTEIKPLKLMHLAQKIFYLIIKTKLYKDTSKKLKRGPKAKLKLKLKYINEEIREDIRIYNDDILSEAELIEFIFNIQNSTTNWSNLLKRINQLDANNIFYLWSYNKHYMFVLERDFGIWGVFNDKACVVPHTIAKIAAVCDDMISCMRYQMYDSYGEEKERDVQNSFGKFMNHMIGKMNPEVASMFPKWDSSVKFKDYMARVLKLAKTMQPYKGLEEADDFYDKIPMDTRRYLIGGRARIGMYNRGKTMNKNEEPIMKKALDKIKVELEEELVPSNSNLVEEAKKRTRKPKVIDDSEGLPPVIDGYSVERDVLKNASTLVRHYHAKMREASDGDIILCSIAADSSAAGPVIDSIKEVGLNETGRMIFFNGWIEYYVRNVLKNRKLKDTNKTSIGALHGTFDKYRATFRIPENS